MIVGDGGCGKTSLLMVYSQGSFPEVRPAGGRVGVRLRGKRAWGHRGRRMAFSLHLEPGLRLPGVLRVERQPPPWGAPSGIPEPSGVRGAELDGVKGGGAAGPWAPVAPLKNQPTSSPTGLRPICVREIHGQSDCGQQGGDPEPVRYRR